MKFVTNDLLEGFSIFFDDAKKHMLRWFGDESSIPDFSNTRLHKAIIYVNDAYLNSDRFDLTDTDFDVSKGIVILYPKMLSEYIKEIYSFWHKCLLYREKGKKFTEKEKYISLFCLHAFNKFRIEFGSDYAANVNTNGRYYYTYNDINTVTGSDQKYLSKQCSKYAIKSIKNSLPKDPAFMDQNSLDGYAELESFYKNFTSRAWQITYLSHIDAQYLVSTLKGYSPTRFCLYENGVDVFEYISDSNLLSKKLKILAKNYSDKFTDSDTRLSGDIGTDSQLISSLFKGKKLKIPLALLVWLDWVFYCRFGDKSRPYKLFSMIKQ